jgi:maleylacetate reductase
MDAFEYTPLQGRIVFGHGTLARIAQKRAFVLSDTHHAETATAKLLEVLGEHAVGLSADVAMHTPSR